MCVLLKIFADMQQGLYPDHAGYPSLAVNKRTHHTHIGMCTEREPRLGPERHVPCRMARMCLPTGHGDPVNDVTLEPLHPALLQRGAPPLPPSASTLRSRPWSPDLRVWGAIWVSPANLAGPPRPH